QSEWAIRKMTSVTLPPESNQALEREPGSPLTNDHRDRRNCHGRRHRRSVRLLTIFRPVSSPLHFVTLRKFPLTPASAYPASATLVDPVCRWSGATPPQT